MKMAIIRGMVLGGSLGIFAALFGFSEVMPRTALFGTIVGALAGYSAEKIKISRSKSKK